MSLGSCGAEYVVDTDPNTWAPGDSNRWILGWTIRSRGDYENVASMRGNHLFAAATSSLEVNACRYRSREGKKAFAIHVNAGRYGESRAIEAGTPLELDVDGKEVSLAMWSGPHSASYQDIPLLPPYCHDEAYYRIRSDELRRIAAASRVRVVIACRGGRLTEHFKRSNIANIRRFVREYG